MNGDGQDNGPNFTTWFTGRNVQIIIMPLSLQKTCFMHRSLWEAYCAQGLAAGSTLDLPARGSKSVWLPRPPLPLPPPLNTR